MFTRFGANFSFGTGTTNSWGEGCINLARVLAIAAAALVPASTAAGSICIALMLMAWVASGLALQTLRAAAVQRAGQAALLFMALLIVGMLYSSASWAERWGSLWSWRKLFFGFILLGFFAEDKWKLRFIKAFLTVAAVGLVASFMGWFGLIHSKSGQYPDVFFTNHATQGMAFTVAVLCCLEMAKSVRPDRHKWCYFGAIVFVINIVFISMSRSAYLALFCVLLLWCVRTYGRKSFSLGTVAIALFALILFGLSPNLRDRVAQGIKEVKAYQTASEITSAGIRVVFFKNTVNLIRDRPVLGYGTGSFGKEYRDRFASSEAEWRSTATSDPHNQYLFILTENGVLGLTAFLILLVVSFQEARGVSPYQRVMQGILLAWCVTSLFNSHFRTFPEGHLIWLFFGAMLSANRLPSSAIRGSQPVAMR